MADTDIGKMRIILEAQTGNAVKSLKEAETSVTKLGAVSVALGNIMADAAVQALQFAQAVAAFPLQAVKQAGQYAEELEHVGAMTGIASDTLQGYGVLLARVGLTNQDLAQGFRALATNIREAKNDTSQAAGAFYALGISLQGNEKPADVLRVIAERLSAMPDGFQKSALASELFGRAGQRMLVAFKDGPEAFDRAAKKAQEFGLILGKDALAQLTRTDDAFDDLGSAIKGFTVQVGAVFAPAVESILGGMTNLIAKATGVVKAFNESESATVGWAKALIELNRITGATGALPPGPQKPTGPLPVPQVTEDMLDALDATKKKYITVADAQQQAGSKIIAQTQVAIEIQRKLGTSFEIAYGLARGKTMQQVDAVVAVQRAQQALGEFLTTKGIKSYADWNKAAEFFAESEFERTSKSIDQYVAMEAQLRAVSAAGDQAALAAGRITPVQFAERSGKLAIEAIDAEIKKQQELLTAKSARYAAEFALAANNVEAQRKLTEQQVADEKAAADAIALLQQQKNERGIQNSSAVTQATEKALQTELQARASTANAEVAILQATYAKTDDIRAARAAAIEAQMQAELSVVGLTEAQKTAIYRNAEAQRMQIAQQFPTFFQKQMQDLVASNQFSLAQISTNFTNATAQWIVTGQNFQQFWTSLQVTIVQAFLNTLVQMAANWLLHQAFMQAGAKVLEETKTAIFGEGEAARIGIAKGASMAIAASMMTTVSAMMAIGEAAIMVMSAVMLQASAMLAMIAGALGESIVGAELAPAVAAASGTLAAGAATMAAAGSAVISAAGSSAINIVSGIGALAKGGIMTQPGMVSFAEKSPEAAIPLNERGAAFMSMMLGMKRDGPAQSQTITVPVYLDGRQIAVATADHTISALRDKGLPI